ncbi:hypothetical protein F2Q70_00018289 [Brassica cretica]|uniref:Uncharacterized protein n=1 Tax=Brassica cretica TaxID=69181 RepID=A0A8S9I184_BRACR|nr:hypothetical protein F2Q70_00018289 [Brassica cretica]
MYVFRFFTIQAKSGSTIVLRMSRWSGKTSSGTVGRLIVVPAETPFRMNAGRSGTRLDSSSSFFEFVLNAAVSSAILTSPEAISLTSMLVGVGSWIRTAGKRVGSSCTAKYTCPRWFPNNVPTTWKPRPELENPSA